MGNGRADGCEMPRLEADQWRHAEFKEKQRASAAAAVAVNAALEQHRHTALTTTVQFESDPAAQHELAFRSLVMVFVH